MALKTETRTIGDLEWTVTQLPSLRGIELTTRVGNLIAPALSGIDPDKLAKTESIEKTDVGAILPALGKALMQLEPKELSGLAREAFASVVVIVEDRRLALTSEASINTAFEGRNESFLPVLKFAIEINCLPFFGGVFSAIMARVAAQGGAAPIKQEASA